jgi:hypothetical protein
MVLIIEFLLGATHIPNFRFLVYANLEILHVGPGPWNFQKAKPRRAKTRNFLLKNKRVSVF